MSDGPDTKPTVNLPVVPEWAIDMTRSMKDGFRTINANIELVSTDLGVVKDRLIIVEKWKSEQDERVSRTSAGVKNLSSADMAHEAELVKEREARQAVESKVDGVVAKVSVIEAKTDKQTEMLASLLKLAANPIVKQIATAIGAGITTYLAMKGVK